MTQAFKKNVTLQKVMAATRGRDVSNPSLFAAQWGILRLRWK
jgi:hypothetical protein